jgi:glycerophosphoryl diester phosphodiesterase
MIFRRGKARGFKRRPFFFFQTVMLLLTPAIRASGGDAPAPEWISLSGGLVAHAGGSINGYEGTNSKEAVLKNYRAGHRVFEIDINLTTDGELVCVHDWPSYSGPLSESEYLDRHIFGDLTPLSLRDVYEIMLEYDDMYLITDTKTFEYSEGEARAQLERLYTLAMETDPSLLGRIVPQVYNQQNYKMLTDIYPFKSVIYTLYASPDTDAEVLAFVKDKPDIAVITMGPVRNSPSFQKKLKKMGKYIYYFTLNDLDEILEARKNGVHGFYTDHIKPADISE